MKWWIMFCVMCFMGVVFGLWVEGVYGFLVFVLK